MGLGWLRDGIFFWFSTCEKLGDLGSPWVINHLQVLGWSSKYVVVSIFLNKKSSLPGELIHPDGILKTELSRWV